MCARRDGPHDAKGNPQGIRAGTYYIRASGPESTPITSPHQWNDLIRRCILNDRDALLREMAGLLSGNPPREPTAAQRLIEWDASTATRFSELLSLTKDFSWPLPLLGAHCQLSYLISHGEGQPPIGTLQSLLEAVNKEVRSTVWTGWSMFFPFTRPDLAPAVFPERTDGTGPDLLETNLIGKVAADSLPDFWRVTPDGRGSIVRGYREDIRFDEPGKWLAPITVIRETAEVVRHAGAFSRFFESATAVSFRCTWLGLRGRELRDFSPGVHWSPRPPASADKRVTTGEWPVAQVNGDWEKVVSDLACPILALFGLTDCSEETVRRMAPKFISI